MEENKTNNYPLDKKFVIIHNFRLAVEEFKPGARLSEKLNMSIGANTEVLIITNFGQISGKLVDPNDQKFEDLGQAFFDTIIKNSAKVINKLDRQNVFNNCELLLIKDAVVTPFPVLMYE